MRTHNFTLASSAIGLALVLSLGACSKQIDDRTVGEKIDAGIAKVDQKTDAALTKAEQKTDQAVAAVKGEVDAAGTGTGNVLKSVKATLTDATITSSIKAELARDPALSALKINVDTTAGRVALHGTAPDAASRERATVLAQRVGGVVGVDNLLEIRSH